MVLSRATEELLVDKIIRTNYLLKLQIQPKAVFIKWILITNIVCATRMKIALEILPASHSSLSNLAEKSKPK